jgi:hypothetical protein
MPRDLLLSPLLECVCGEEIPRISYYLNPNSTI